MPVHDRLFLDDASKRGWMATSLGQAVLAVIVGCLYALAAHISLALVPPPEHIALFWPASGLAAGVLIALGRRARVAVVVGVVIATIAVNMASRSNLGATLVFAASNAVECLIAAWVFERLDPEGAGLERLRGVFAFIVAATAGAAVAALPAAVALHQFGLSPSALHKLWLVWFKSDAVGIISVAPLLMTLPTLWREPLPAGKLAEGILAVTLASLAIGYAFSLGSTTSAWPVIAPSTLLFPVVLWLAIRMRPVFTAATICVCTLVLLSLVLRGLGRIGDPSVPLAERVIVGQLALLTLSLCGLTLSAAMTQLGNVVRDLKATEERLLLGLNAGGVYAFDLDVARKRAYRFGGLTERLGLRAVGHMGDYNERLHPDDRERFMTLQASITPGKPYFSDRFRLKNVDGEYLIVVHRAHATFDAKGQLLRIVGTAADVTQRHLAEQALQASDERLRNSLRMGRVFAFDWDALSNEVKRSDNAADILGVSTAQAQMSRNDFITYVHPEDRGVVQRDVAALTPRTPLNTTSFRFVRPDKRVAWLEIAQGATFDADGRLLRISGLTRDVTERRLAEERQSLLIDELNHRVKNTLARMSAVIKSSREGHQTVEDYSGALEGRIMSMARTHQRLSANKWDGVGLATLVKDELEPYRTATNTAVDGADIVLAADAAQSMSLTLHELATNAAKHGALSRTSGRVTVLWSIEEVAERGQMLRLTWRESAGWGIKTNPTQGFGVKTISQLMNFELDATVALDFTPSGAHCTIELPVKQVVAVPGAGFVHSTVASATT